MAPSRIALHGSYLAAAALVAAAVGDLVVESVANSGILGGHYADSNHTSVLPTLLAGAFIALDLVALRVAGILRRRALASHACARRAIADLPFVFVLELTALFAMEGTEQLVATGTVPAGTAWLGGPIAFSLGVHALLTIAAMLGLRRLIRALSATVASLLLVAIGFVRVAPPGADAPFSRRRYDPASRRWSSPHLLRIGGRAPPPLLSTI